MDKKFYEGMISHPDMSSDEKLDMAMLDASLYKMYTVFDEKFHDQAETVLGRSQVTTNEVDVAKISDRIKMRLSIVQPFEDEIRLEKNFFRLHQFPEDSVKTPQVPQDVGFVAPFAHVV